MDRILPLLAAQSAWVRFLLSAKASSNIKLFFSTSRHKVVDELNGNPLATRKLSQEQILQ